MIKAIIWDFDGTLVDTRVKNLNVTKAIIEEITKRPHSEFPCLCSLESYKSANCIAANWRELYKNEFNLSPEEVDYAGSLWTKYQLLDHTLASFYEGINYTIETLGQYPHGIVSQNSKQNIIENLERNSLSNYFKYVVGYEEVDFSKQKPNPEGLLHCISQLASLDEDEVVIYIGDHETDTLCALNAQNHLQRKVVSIGAFYDKQDLSNTWNYQPDYKAYSPMDILQIVDLVNKN